MSYIVERHGGCQNHVWRTVLKTENYDEALSKYKDMCSQMRQGRLRIVSYEDGKSAILEETTAPRLRIYW